MIVCARRWHFCCRLHASDDLDRSRTTAATKTIRDLIAARKGTRQRAAYPETFVHLRRLISSTWQRHENRDVGRLA